MKKVLLVAACLIARSARLRRLSAAGLAARPTPRRPRWSLRCASWTRISIRLRTAVGVRAASSWDSVAPFAVRGWHQGFPRRDHGGGTVGGGS